MSDPTAGQCCPGHGTMAHVRGCVNHPETTDPTAGERPKGRLVAHPEPGKVWVQVPHRNDIGNDWIEADELPVPATPDRAIPTRASLLDGLAATRAADEKAREQRLPWSAP